LNVIDLGRRQTFALAGVVDGFEVEAPMRVEPYAVPAERGGFGTKIEDAIGRH
jgi:hypothetical protein